MTQPEIALLLTHIPEGCELWCRLEKLLVEESTLRVLYDVGLAEGQSDDIQRRFRHWVSSPTIVYASEEDAKEACPQAFKEVCTTYGRAGYVNGRYILTDGRIVLKRGIWSDTSSGPDPVVFFFEQKS